MEMERKRVKIKRIQKTQEEVQTKKGKWEREGEMGREINLKEKKSEK